MDLNIEFKPSIGNVSVRENQILFQCFGIQENKKYIRCQNLTKMPKDSGVTILCKEHYNQLFNDVDVQLFNGIVMCAKPEIEIEDGI